MFVSVNFIRIIDKLKGDGKVFYHLLAHHEYSLTALSAFQPALVIITNQVSLKKAVVLFLCRIKL